MIASILSLLILLILSFLPRPKPIHAATRSWSFNLAENYTFNSKIEVIDGMVQLKDQPYSVDDDTPGLWHLDEASGILYDATDNDNDLTPSGGPTYGGEGADDKYNTSLYFDGVDDYLYLPHDDQEDLDLTDEITLEAWIKREEDTGETEEIISKWKSKGKKKEGAYELMITDDDQLMFRVSKDGKKFEKIISSLTIPLNTWTHIAGVYDGEYLRLYTNGVPAATPVAYDEGISDKEADFQIAKDSHFKGRIDEIRVSDVARTSFFAYSPDKSTIQPVYSQTFSSLSGFSETATKNRGEIYYQLSNDRGSSWKYWDGSSWKLAGATDYNTASVVNENISSFPTGEGNFLFKAFLSSDGTQLVQLDNIQVSYNNAPNTPSSLGPSNYLDGSWGNNNTPTLEFTQFDPDEGDTVKYRIQIDDSSDFGSPVVDYASPLISQGPSSFTVGQALADGYYYWRVMSEDQNGATSSWAIANSGNIAFKVDTAAPTNVGISSITLDSPSQLTVTAFATTDKGAGLHSTPYWFNETLGNPGASGSSDWQASTSFINDGLSANTQYAYQVKAKDAVGNESSYSAHSSNKYTLANQVTDLKATRATDKTSYKINLSWTNQGQSGMKIEQDTNCDGYETTLYDNASANLASPYQVSVAANTCYKFRISTYNGDGVLNTTSIPETSSITSGNTLPLSEESKEIKSNASGMVTLDDLILKVPAGYFITPVTFQIQKFAFSSVLNPIIPPPGKAPVGLYVYDLKAYLDPTTTLSSFDQPIAITLSYSDSDIAGIDESSLRIYHWDGTGWNQLSSCAVDTLANSVTCETVSFSLFALWGEESSDFSSSSSSTTSLPSLPTCGDTPPGNKAPWLYGAIPQGPNSIELYFTEADEPLDKYILEYGLESGNYIFGSSNIGGKGTRTYLVQHLSPNTTYYFKVRAGNGCATGPWSNEISARTTPFVSLAKLEPEIIEEITMPKEKKEIAKEQEKQPGSYTVKVKVVDRNKKPIKGARVTLFSTPREATTGENGEVVFENVEKGEHKVIIAYKGQVEEQKINQREVKEFNFTIQVGQTNSFLNPLVMFTISLLLVESLYLLYLRRHET